MFPFVLQISKYVVPLWGHNHMTSGRTCALYVQSAAT